MAEQMVSGNVALFWLDSVARIKREKRLCLHSKIHVVKRAHRADYHQARSNNHYNTDVIK